jgi:hypothetical protein
MPRAYLVPLNESDFVAEMATVLRTNGMTFGGGEAEVEERAFEILWRTPSARGGYAYAEIQSRLTAVIAQARALGPVDLEGVSA